MVETGESENADGHADADAVRAELANWVQAHWDPSASLVQWRTRLVDAGWASPSWPRRWFGRGLPAWADELIPSELVRLGAVGLPLGGGTGLAAPTIFAHGSDEVRDRFLRPIFTGEERWCQLFSEPGAGSDLAGLGTHAELDGDEWVVNGQKVWNTSAHHADFGMLVARTDPGKPKHRGLSYFALPMRQPGVQVRPLRQMNDHASFNEVFLADARIPAANLIGAVGDGWKVALTTLAYERRFGAMSRPKLASSDGRAFVEARAEADSHFETYRWYPQRAGRPDLVVERARSSGKSADAMVRDAAARVLSLQQASKVTADRARSARALGRPPGAEGSIGKLASSELARLSASAHSLIGGAHGMLRGADAPLDGLICEILLSVPAQSIAGGTDQIQKNIIGEKMLGLPREPAEDRDMPFNQTRRNR